MISFEGNKVENKEDDSLKKKKIKEICLSKKKKIERDWFWIKHVCDSLVLNVYM
jgi:hypothetical protein